MPFSCRQLVSIQNLKPADFNILFKHAQKMETALKQGKILKSMQNKILAALFYEPSTRTRLSFETAMLRLGGQFINAIGMENSSLKKGETISDTIQVISHYADIIVMRHPTVGSAKEAAEATKKPFLNAGDGPGEHPTQALLDAYTILKTKKKLDGLTIGFVGDLKFGRTIHSLVYLLSNFKVKFSFISAPGLFLPDAIKTFLKKKKIVFTEESLLEKALPALDIMYVTRIQKERFADLGQYERVKDTFIVTRALLKKGKKNLGVLHPLPRVNEISHNVDTLPGALYFEQVKNSVPVRMALLDLIVNG